METSSFEDPMFSEFSTDAMLNSMAPKAIQHHHYITAAHHHHHHHGQQIMIGNGGSGDISQHTRLPAISEIQHAMSGNSPKLDGYKTLDYSHIKMESPTYSPNGKIEYLNGNNTTKLESYSSNGQYSPNAKIIEFSTASVSGQQQHIEQHIQLYHQPQSLDGNQQTTATLINGADGNFKRRKSDENLNNLSGSPTPTTIINSSSISPSDGNPSSTSPNKKPSVDKKKNDPNGVKKKKTR